MSGQKLYTSTRISSNDGFTVCRFLYHHDLKFYNELMSILGSKNSPQQAASDAGYVQNKLFSFLKKFSTNSFCVSRGWSYVESSYKVSTIFYVGFREEKDAFKFTLKVPGSKYTKMWESELSFIAIIREGDEFVPKTCGKDWNHEDPHGGINGI